VNLLRDPDGIGDDPCPLADECVATAIASDLSVLRSDADDNAKLAALESLGHWVGDVHQPLHVSFEDDRGGNSIKVRKGAGAPRRRPLEPRLWVLR
jgi:S1/P1 Nuclease